jgi:hypothetical protein
LIRNMLPSPTEAPCHFYIANTWQIYYTLYT